MSKGIGQEVTVYKLPTEETTIEPVTTSNAKWLTYGFIGVILFLTLPKILKAGKRMYR
jgi:uncharacterized membrane protein SirB2